MICRFALLLEFELVLRERDDIPSLELFGGGDTRPVEVAPIEAPEIEEIKSTILFSHHGMATRDPRIVNRDLALCTPSKDRDATQFVELAALDQFEISFQMRNEVSVVGLLRSRESLNDRL